MIGFLSKLFTRTVPAILEARPRDSSSLAAIHAHSFPVGWSEQEFERLLADYSVIAHIARTDGGRGAIAGFMLSRIAADEAEILTVAVAPGERGRGLAGQLLHRHLGRLAALGVAQVFLEVGEDNRPALRLYDNAGFRQVGRRAGYYPRPEGTISALTLRRDLV
jgi:ribosomal-protein-alanine N-acetyltransferase